MLDGFLDWLNDWRNAGVLFFSIVCICSLFILLINAEIRPTTIYQNIELPKTNILQKVTWIYENQNVTYAPVTYPFTNQRNVTIMLVTTFFSEPITILDYAVLTCNFDNGTHFKSNESVSLILYLSTFENEDDLTGEYYLTIYGEPL